jgi:hypothetical protein
MFFKKPGRSGGFTPAVPSFKSCVLFFYAEYNEFYRAEQQLFFLQSEHQSALCRLFLFSFVLRTSKYS